MENDSIMNSAPARHRAYLDNAANTTIRPAARQAISDAWEVTGNPSSLHASGRAARRVLEEARESVAADLGALPGEVVFTSGGTEANNLALLGMAGKGEVIVSAVEHPSVAALVERADNVRVAPVDEEGRVRIAEVAQMVRPSTALVSVMWVNNETGVVQPVEELAALLPVRFHTDAVQALGHLPVRFLGDLLSLSGHKVGGPVGIGALLVRRGLTLRPPGFGGGQEAKLRSGTVPVALAAGFAAAVHEAVTAQPGEAVRLAGLGERLASGVADLPGVLLTTTAPASPAIIHLVVEGARADDVLLVLDGQGIDASTGSACSAGVHQPSEVLLAMGRSVAAAAGALRFSFGPTTTVADIDRLLGVLPEAITLARRAW